MSCSNISMNRKINKIMLFANNNEYSKKIEREIKEKLLKRNYIISNDINDTDLAIAIGGDGSFLRMVKACNFNDNVSYIGINTGTLGFVQEIYPDKIDTFLNNLDKNRYKSENISIQETKITTKEETVHFFSLNEIVVREKELNTAHFKVLIDGCLLENYSGDGLLISTSFGSTAYNLSFKGSIVFNELHTLQITPIAPLNNKNYSSLINSIIIPQKRIIEIIPSKDSNLIISIDGENKYLNNVTNISTYVKRKRIKLIRTKEYDYTKKVNEKFL